MALAWVFPDEKSQLADAVLDQVIADGGFAPALWKLEVANVLRMAVRRQRCSEEFETSSLKRLDRVPVTTDRETDVHAWRTTRQLAMRYGLSIYDACYLELAKRRSLPLATLDGALTAAARKAGLEVIGD
jgi:predicted nucleic acid-binding protein